MKSTLQRRPNMSDFLLPFMGLIVIFMMYAFILRPINRRYDAALNHILGKEIARRLYQEIDPNFTYNASHEEDIQRHIILNSSVEEFRKLLNNKKKCIKLDTDKLCYCSFLQ